MLTVSRRRPSWSLAWATWTSPWVSTPTVTRVGWACAMVVMAISLRLRAWGGWHAPAGWADSTAMGLWAQASIRSRLLGWRCEAVAAASSRQIRSRARSRWTAGVRPLPRPPETSSQWTLDRIAEVIWRLTGCVTTPPRCGGCCAIAWTGACNAPPAARSSGTSRRSASGSPATGPGSKKRQAPQGRHLLLRRVRRFADPDRALDLGAPRAHPRAGPPVQLEARLDRRRLVLWLGRWRLPARLPRPAGQLRHRAPDRRAGRAAALFGWAEGDPAVGRAARPPQQPHEGLDRQPARLAGGGAATRLRARAQPDRGAVGQPQGQGRRVGLPCRRHAAGGHRGRPAWHRPGPPHAPPAVFVSPSLRTRPVVATVTLYGKAL